MLIIFVYNYCNSVAIVGEYGNNKIRVRSLSNMLFFIDIFVISICKNERLIDIICS